VAGRVAWIGARARTPAPPLTAAVASAGAAPASSHFSAAATWPKLKPPAPPPRCWPLAAGGGATGCGLLTRVEPPCTPALGVTSSVTEAQTLARRLTLWCRMRGWARPAQHSRCPLHPCLTCITTRRCLLPPRSAAMPCPPRWMFPATGCSRVPDCCCAHNIPLAAYKLPRHALVPLQTSDVATVQLPSGARGAHRHEHLQLVLQLVRDRRAAARAPPAASRPAPSQTRSYTPTTLSPARESRGRASSHNVVLELDFS